MLFTHIKHNLPEIMREIKDKIREIEDRLKDLGPCLPMDGHEKMQLLWQMVSEFTQTYKNTIHGKYDSKRYQDAPTSVKKREISGGARIKLMFHSLYKDFGANY